MFVLTPALRPLIYLNGKRFYEAPARLHLAAVTLWLLASMIIDALRTKRPTVYMIGSALAPHVGRHDFARSQLAQTALSPGSGT